MIWVASFPRSGNHRCRQIIFNLLFDRQATRKELDQLEELGYKKTHSKADNIEGKVIYLVRDEADVIQSVNRFFRFNDVERAKKYVLEGPENNWRHGIIGSRKENMKSYFSRPDALILKYEDFSPEHVRRIARFCGLSGDYNKIYNWNIGENARYIDKDFNYNNPYSSPVIKP